MATIAFAISAYKGTLSASLACQSAEEGWRRNASKIKILHWPASDGGDGLLECLLTRRPAARRIAVTVTGPLGTPIESFFLIDRHQGLLTAVIETSRICGLSLVPLDQRDVMAATTFGIGEAIRHAINHEGAQQIYIGLGGSATQDGGAGMAHALGARLVDRFNKQIGPGNRWLSALDRVSVMRVESRIRKTPTYGLCDVLNPLLGPKGTAYVFAPQKGASKAQVVTIEDNLRFYSEIIERDLKFSVADVPGAGAAGGLGAGLMVFCRAKLVPGAETFMEMTGMTQEMDRADAVVVGEGRVDRQTVMGKAPYVIAQTARRAGKKVFGIFGQVALADSEMLSLGFDEWVSLEKVCGGLEKARANPKEGIAKAAAALAQRWNVLATVN
ncbi:MAG: glycerate kinase [Elusimicrobia bacterium]|nr:glycerate kinase [Elusimicrobiota bacterium]